MTGYPVPHAIGLNLCGVSVCCRVLMLKLLLALVISSLAVEQLLLAQTAAPQEAIGTSVVRQRAAEGEVERNLQTIRLSVVYLTSNQSRHPNQNWS